MESVRNMWFVFKILQEYEKQVYEKALENLPGRLSYHKRVK